MFGGYIFKTFETGSKALRLCGNGAENNWSVRIADRFFVDCACCLFWRGVFLGAVLACLVIIIMTWVL